MRSLSLTILCSLALIVGAGPAGAQAEPLFAADSYPATIDGAGLTSTIFSFSGAKWECKTSSFEGKLTGAAASLTLSPAYKECRWNYPVVNPPAWSVVQVSMNGCDFHLHSLKFTVTDQYTSALDLQCPAGKQVVVDLSSGPWATCKLTVAAQSNKVSTQLTVNTGKEGKLDDVQMQYGATRLVYTQDLVGSPIACPIKPGTYEFLEVEGTATLTATSEPGKQIGFRVSGE